MILRITVLLLTIIAVTSCNNEIVQEEKQKEVPVEIVTSTDTTQSHLPKNQTWDSNTVIGEAVIWRSEEVDGSNDWTSVAVTNIFGFKNDIPAGDIVQIIPLINKLPVLGLKIIDSKKMEGYDENDIWYNIKLEEVENKEYWTFEGPEDRRAEFPLDVLVVYPAVKSCSLMETKNIKTEDLPSNITLELILGALDFDEDGSADAIVCKFCCKTRTQVGDCDYTCGEVYLKVGEKWMMVDSSMPA